MAQEREATGGTANIERVGKRKKGYDVRQVDAFLEQAHALYEQDGVELKRSDIQDASFDIVKGGYAIPQVDATLERLAKAVSDKDTSYEIAELGRVAWKAQVEALYHQLEAHAERAEGERFASGEAKRPSYDRKQVDRLIDRIIDQAGDELDRISSDAEAAYDDGAKLTAQSVSDVMFTQRKGKRGYDERQVDYYLNACADLLGRLESYARVSTYAERRPAAAPTSSAPAVAPLIPDHAAAPRTTASHMQPTVVQPALSQPNAVQPVESLAPEQSFDELHKAEQAIFTPTTPTASPVTPASATAATTIPVSDDVAEAAAAAGATVAATAAQHNDEARDLTQTQSFGLPLAPHETAATSHGSSSVARAHTLSDIKPITPAPRTIPEHERVTPTPPAVPDDLNAVPMVTAVSDETTITFGDTHQPALDSPSLAALASLAKSTETLPEEPKQPSAMTTSSGLSVPTLANVTIPDLPVRRPMDAAAASSSTASISASASTSAASNAGHDTQFVPPDTMNVEIPDLEFPTFSTDGPLVTGDTDRDGR